MNTNQAFPSKYLKADDGTFSAGEVIATIKDVSMQKFSSQENGEQTKPLMSFRELPKSLILNKTNWNTCAKLFGSDESDDWIGQKVILMAVDDEAFGKPTRVVRVKDEKPKVDKQKVISYYTGLFEKAKALKLEGLEKYTITPDMESQVIIDMGKELRTKVEAAEAFA